MGKKKIIISFFCIFLMAASNGWAACLDVDNDGKIGLKEAIYALQIAAGMDVTAADTVTNSLGQTFIAIAPGTFMMGSPAEEAGREGDETLHEVTLKQKFYMMTTEVTQGQWQTLMGTNPSANNACGSDCPVENVSWEDTQSFISVINALNEGTYRLPTEAEWEYACRAGSSTAFANGDITQTQCEIDPSLNVMGWYCGNSNYQTHPAAQKQANPWGLYDMHGNVWEWCLDWSENYPEGSVTDPTGPQTGLYKVARGGSYGDHARGCRSAERNCQWPTHTHARYGFRLVMEAN